MGAVFLLNVSPHFQVILFHFIILWALVEQVAHSLRLISEHGLLSHLVPNFRNFHFISQALVEQVAHDLHLISERVRKLTGAQGVARLEAALAAARAAAAAAAASAAAAAAAAAEQPGSPAGGSGASTPQSSPEKKVGGGLGLGLVG